MDDELARIARALEQNSNLAVREIITQRDKAQANLVSMTRDRDWYQRSYGERGEAIIGRDRRIAALQGVITRMKKARNA